jgi:hypothetical protein
MYNEERRGKLDYLGYIKPKQVYFSLLNIHRVRFINHLYQRGCAVTKPHNHEQLVTIQFAWEHEIKPVSTR